MTIRHHPSDALLTGFAAGTLDRGRHIAIATHLVACPQCRRWVRALEEVGGATLADLPPTPMATGALAAVEARFGDFDPAGRSAATTPAAIGPDDVPRLPDFVRRYPSGEWKWIAPRVYLRPIILPEASETRVFLLKSGPGTKMLQHSHSGLEMTCVLAGAFQHAGGRYGPGDFDLGDPTIDHKPVVDAGEECVCLVAMQGRLQLNGILGGLMQPFIRL